MTTTYDATLTRHLQQLLDATSAAWADGDAETFAAYYTQDATAILPGFRLADREAIRSSMAVAFDGSLRRTRRVHEVLNVRALGTDAVIVTTASATLAADEAVAPGDRQEWATWVLVRADSTESWRIKAYHGSPVLNG